MANARKCDICGKFYENYTTKSRLGRDQLEVDGFRFGNDGNTTKHHYWDCCVECLTSIENRIKSLMPKVEELKKSIKEPCRVCKYSDVSGLNEPCCSCNWADKQNPYNNWQPKEETAPEIADKSERTCDTCRYYNVTPSDKGPCKICSLHPNNWRGRMNDMNLHEYWQPKE